MQFSTIWMYPRDYHTKQSKSEGERQIPYISLICGI